MKPLRSLLRVVALLSVAALGTAYSDAQTAPTRIMPLGDSLTSGTTVVGAYRNSLHTLLTGSGYVVDFVGTQTDAGNPSLPDKDHQGMGGFRIDQLQAELPSYLNAIEDPDVVLLMIGTNDFWTGYNISSAPGRLASLIADIASKRPFAKIIVASLPLRTDNATFEAQQSAFNAQIPGIVADQVALGRQVSFVDIHAVLQPGDLEEGVHPTQAGYQKIAAAWHSAINSITTAAGTSNPPAISKVEASADAQHVTITFSKPVADSAALASHYSLNGGLAVTQATLDVSSKRKVTLTTSPQSPGTLYTLAVQGVVDRTPQQNAIAPGTTASFSSATLANGGFEAGETGWNMTGSYLVYGSSDPYFATEGTNMLVLNGSQSVPSAVVSQTFATVPGQTYKLRYDFGQVAFNFLVQRMGVEVTGSSTLFSKTETINGNGLANSVWQTKAYTFIADSPTTTLTFRDLSSSGNGADLLLDGVKVTALPANLLANGSFEGGESGWDMAGNRLVYPTELPYTPTDGINILVFNGAQTLPDGVVSQTFATTPGSSYTLEFDFGILATNTLEQRLGVEISGTSTIHSSIESLFGNAKGASFWTNRRYVFTADSASTTLTFLDLSATSTNLDLMVDHVRITAQATLPNSAPTAVADAYSTNQNTPLTVIAPGVLSNDSDTEGNALTAVLETTTSHGSLSLNANGGFTYTPDSGYAGPDSFTYQASDGSLSSNTVTVNLSVNPTNGAPVAVADSYSTLRDTPLVIPPSGVLANDTDSQFDPLTAVLDAGPSHGSLTLNANGGFTYTPAAAYTGTDSFTYHANDGSLDSNITTVSLSVLAPSADLLVNGSFESGFAGWTAAGNQSIQSALPYTPTDGIQLVAFNSNNQSPNATLTQSFATVPGETYTLTFDLGVLSYIKRHQKLAVSVVGNSKLLSRVISLRGTGDGTSIWTHQSFTFIADDDVATLTFTDRSKLTNGLDLLLDKVRVKGLDTDPNQVPVAFADEYSVNKNTVLHVPASGVLTNDFSPNSATLTAVLETHPSFGTVILDPDGGFSYWPTTGYIGTDTFTYRADGNGQKSKAVTVTISLVDVDPGMLNNPSFESGFAGWTTTGNQSIEYYSPTDGVKIADFNSGNRTPNATLSQSFATIAGKSYQLAFDCGVLAYTTDSQVLQVTLNGSASLLSKNITLQGDGDGGVRWSHQEFVFVADSASTTLVFRDLSTATVGIDLLIDSVRVTAVPEPARTSLTDTSGGDIAPQVSIHGNDVAIKMTAPLTGNYVIEGSEDLKSWFYLDEAQTNALDPVEFHDSLAPGGTKPRMFYRVGVRQN